MTQRTRRTVRALALFALLVATPTVIATVARLLGASPPRWIMYVTLPIVVPTFVVVEALLERREAKRQRRLMFPHCVRCGYDLTGNETGTCPECGCVFR
jgi:hypothetical protein